MEPVPNNLCVMNNVLYQFGRLDADYVVKVGDFGLARDVYSHLYYRANKHARVPIKWASPETLNDGLCNEKSDVVCHSIVTVCRVTVPPPLPLSHSLSSSPSFSSPSGHLG